MDVSNIDRAQGHWLLAKVGKRVLRPGGKELSLKLVDVLKISSNDDLVEFAPGMGKTASLLIEKKPKTYTGVDADMDVVNNLQEKFKTENVQFVHSKASDTGLKPNSIDKLIGEAMLTMHADQRKTQIIKEANRILKPGGRYGIHELALKPDSISEDIKTEISRELAMSIRVNARPLTVFEWRDLLKANGFRIIEVHRSPMLLLETKRILEDEGLVRTLKIGFNVLTNPKAMKRILNMRKVFRKYEANMCSVAIIAEKV